MDSLQLIRTFLEVARRGSFSGAARALNTSKANVSKYVAELETRLGVRLLNRSTRTVSLTDAGSLLQERSTPLLEMIELTREEVQGRASEPSGRLRLTAAPGLVQAGLSEALGEFMQRHAAVSISLHLENQSIDLVDEGMDVAFRVGRITDANQIVRRLQQVEFVVAASPEYWARHGQPELPEELSGHDALTYSLLGPNPYWSFEVDGVPLSVSLHSRMDSSDARPLLASALLGLGIVNMPRLVVAQHLASGALQEVLLGTSPKDVWFYAAYSQRRYNSAALKALLAFMEERFRTSGS